MPKERFHVDFPVDFSDSPLQVIATNGMLQIRIGQNVLAFAVKSNPQLFTDESEVEITDNAELLKAITAQLSDEAEDGTTLVHSMLDKAFQKELDFGDCEAIKIIRKD